MGKNASEQSFSANKRGISATKSTHPGNPCHGKDRSIPDTNARNTEGYKESLFTFNKVNTQQN